MKRWMVLMLAVGFVLTASFSAQADSVLLPWIVKDEAISTIVTLVNTVDPTQVRAGSKVRFHIIYEYKRTTANGQTEACEEFDFCVPTSYNDILVFDAAGNFNNGAPLFGDTTVQGTQYAVNPASLALPVDGPRRAFLIATNEIYTSEVCGSSEVAGYEDSIYAEAMVIDISNGAAWGYDGYNPRNTSRSAVMPFIASLNFNDNDTAVGGGPTDALGQVVASDKGEVAFLTIMPPSVFTTKLFVTPINNPRSIPPTTTMWTGDLTVGIQLYCAIDGITRQDVNTLAGMFDYDERCLSFDVVKNVKCTDASTIDHYMSSAVWNIFKNTNAEGWAYLFLPDDDRRWTRQATIGKLEYNIGTTSFDGGQVKGAINNFIWVRGRIVRW